MSIPSASMPCVSPEHPLSIPGAAPAHPSPWQRLPPSAVPPLPSSGGFRGAPPPRGAGGGAGGVPPLPSSPRGLRTPLPSPESSAERAGRKNPPSPPKKGTEPAPGGGGGGAAALDPQG